ncbi:MAG: restriction endonuclease [archaeon]
MYEIIKWYAYAFLLFFGFIIGAIVGILTKSGFLFWFIFLGPTILILFSKYYRQYESTRKFKEDIENRKKEEENKLLLIQKNVTNIIEKLDEFRLSKSYNLLSKFVVNLDYDMAPELYWLSVKNIINKDNVEFLKLKTLLEYPSNFKISINDYNDFLESYYKIEAILKDLSFNLEKKYISNTNNVALEDLLYENITNLRDFEDLKSLLESKGFKFSEGEIVYLIICEKSIVEHNKLDKQLILNNASSLNDYISNFVQYKYNYDDTDVDILIVLLKKKNLEVDKKDLLDKINKLKKEIKLENFENKLLNDNYITISEVDKLTGYEFEDFLIKLYKKMNYKIIEHTKLSNDQGADLVVEKEDIKYVVQAKKYKGSVGNDAIQAVVASIKHYKANKGIVITNSNFTRQAKELAESNKVELIDREDLKKLIKEYL